MKQKKGVIFFVVNELQPATDEYVEESFAVDAGKDNE